MKIGSPHGKKLDFALACISAIRKAHDIHRPMTGREISELTVLITHEAGWSKGGCTRQNIDRIEKTALRKLGRTLSETIGLQEILDHVRT